MVATLDRQDDAIASTIDSIVGFLDNIEPSLAAWETNATDLAYDLNALRSMGQDFLNRDGPTFPVGNWYDGIVQPTGLENGTKRGLNATGAAVHLIEQKRWPVCVYNLHSIAGGAGQGVKLGTGELPANLIANVGGTVTIGTMVAEATTFGTYSAADVEAGTNAISPLNLVDIVESANRDPILDTSGRRIYGLLQTEDGTDGHTMTDSGATEVQISFVVIASGALQLAAATEMTGKTFDYCHTFQKRFADLTVGELRGGANVDVHARDTENQEGITTEAISSSDTALADTLNATPINAACFKLFLNGVFQDEGTGRDYTRSGGTITWLASSGTAVNMKTSDTLTATYIS